MAVDEAALRCDMLETYHIFDYRALPMRQAALFAGGLHEDSRIMRKLSGAPASFNTIMLASIADSLRILIWQNTENGANGTNMPDSILSALFDQQREKVGFDSAADFDSWRQSLLNGENE